MRDAPAGHYCRWCPSDVVFVVPSLARDHEAKCYFRPDEEEEEYAA